MSTEKSSLAYLIVSIRLAWDALMCETKASSNSVILVGSILSKYPRTPQKVTTICSAISIGAEKEYSILKIKVNAHVIVAGYQTNRTAFSKKKLSNRPIQSWQN